MFYILTVMLILAGLTMKKDKKIEIIIVLFLFFLIGWSFDNADYSVHLRRFMEYGTQRWQTELTYSLLMSIFNKLGLDYRAFLVCFSAFLIIVYTKFINKHTSYVNYVWCLYLIFPLCMDANMVRYTLSIVVVYLGMNNLYSKEKSAIVKYIIFVILGTMIHMAAIFSLLFLLPRFFDRKKLVCFVGISVTVLSVFTSIIFTLANRLSSISFFNIGAKINIILNASNLRYTRVDTFKYMGKILIIFVAFALAYYSIISWINKQNISEHDENVKFLNRTFDMNISLLLVLPLVMFSPDIFRIQLSLSLVNYVAIAQYFDIRRKIGKKVIPGKISQSTLIVFVASIIYAFSALYLWVLSSENYVSVFRSLFENNVLIK